MAGDFGRIARFTLPLAEEFMTRVPLWSGASVLDVACGTGNLALLAARSGCAVSGLDLAPNLLVQAHRRAAAENLSIQLEEGDAEQLPYADASFDLVVSMFGVMFAANPDRAAAELLRVCRPGGVIALANWTPDGFVGQMLRITREFVRPPQDLPSPLQWGEEGIVRERLQPGAVRLEVNRCLGRMRFPFSPPATVELFRQFYGPTERVFASLSDEQQARFRRALENLFSEHNLGGPNVTDVAASYLCVTAVRAA